eukprot:CAMPEP_0172858882 /NCGR_PEP_ID=MMETSP1075-20121228/68194_1 /TAXON_ID=2916 /ORGANISM="Ceratium fusus, Strain PA161109" /LENGTH=248 /DNA_ID=CAMNT_0013706537 /DNA_START=27 /DNA_END=773 /DNA_ORIENTATION=-
MANSAVHPWLILPLSGLLSFACGEFTLPALPYAYDALEPHIDAETMTIHHGKHHATYVANLNKAVPDGTADLASLAEMQASLVSKGAAARNNGGGHYNHAFFWVNLVPSSGPSMEPSPDLAAAIEDRFGSLDNMKAEFEKAALGRFGSGWAWLGVRPDGTLGITSTANQDNPLMEGLEYAAERMVPILGLDVWEHAYYLKYRNRRPDYVKAFWNVVNWNKVSRSYDVYARKQKPVPPTSTGGGHAVEL